MIIALQHTLATTPVRSAHCLCCGAAALDSKRVLSRLLPLLGDALLVPPGQAATADQNSWLLLPPPGLVMTAAQTLLSAAAHTMHFPSALQQLLRCLHSCEHPLRRYNLYHLYHLRSWLLLPCPVAAAAPAGPPCSLLRLPGMRQACSSCVPNSTWLQPVPICCC
jgi:hypothetical protein